jgi:hypothetical protein
MDSCLQVTDIIQALCRDACPRWMSDLVEGYFFFDAFFFAFFLDLFFAMLITPLVNQVEWKRYSNTHQQQHNNWKTIIVRIFRFSNVFCSCCLTRTTLRRTDRSSHASSKGATAWLRLAA